MRKPALREASGSKRIRADRPISLTEDEADGIISRRRESEKSIPFEKVLKQHGYTLDGEGKAVRKPDCATLIGSMRGKLKVKGNIFSTGLHWKGKRTGAGRAA